MVDPVVRFCYRCAEVAGTSRVHVPAGMLAVVVKYWVQSPTATGEGNSPAAGETCVEFHNASEPTHGAWPIGEVEALG
jgi:hypothetical protein